MNLRKLENRVRRIEQRESSTECPACQSRNSRTYEWSNLTEEEKADFDQLTAQRNHHECSCGIEFTRTDLSTLKVSELLRLREYRNKAMTPKEGT